MSIEEAYLQSIRKLFLGYKMLGEKSFDQIHDAEINERENDASNSIALIVKHLHGNMRSRWTNFLTTDGEKPDRDRELEFEGELKSKQEMIALWEEGWGYLFTTLNSLIAADLDKTIYIRAEAHTVLEAINRQLAHYSYHIGQVVYLAKAIRSGSWKSLSIPKGQSKSFNEGKFKKG